MAVVISLLGFMEAISIDRRRPVSDAVWREDVGELRLPLREHVVHARLFRSVGNQADGRALCAERLGVLEEGRLGDPEGAVLASGLDAALESAEAQALHVERRAVRGRPRRRVLDDHAIRRRTSHEFAPLVAGGPRRSSKKA